MRHLWIQLFRLGKASTRRGHHVHFISGESISLSYQVCVVKYDIQIGIIIHRRPEETCELGDCTSVSFLDLRREGVQSYESRSMSPV